MFCSVYLEDGVIYEKTQSAWMQATPRRTACWPTCLDRNSVEDALFRCFFLVLCLVLRQAKVVRSAFARIHRLRSKPQRHLAHITEILPRNKFGR